MTHKHPKFFQNSGLIMGSIGVFIFSAAFTIFAIDTYNTPISADQATTATNDNYDYMSKQVYSAVAISDMPESKNCKEGSLGQVVVVTDIKDFESSGDKRIEVAVSTGLIYTKRGILQKIDSKYTSKIVEAYNKAKNSGSEAIKDTSFSSGLYFTDIPINSELQLQLYSPSWGTKSITISNATQIKDACGTIFVPVIGLAQKEGDMQVCVHSTNKSDNYKPKKTFSYPKEETDIKSYMAANAESIVSLGPCQGTAELVKKINAEKSLDEAKKSKESASSIGYVDNPEGTGGDNSAASADERAKQISDEFNKQRKAVGLSPLTEDPELAALALKRAKVISDVDTGKTAGDGKDDGHPFFERDTVGTSTVGEIRTSALPLSMTANDVWILYRDSKNHKEQILSSTHKKMGNAVIIVNNQALHVAEFGD